MDFETLKYLWSRASTYQQDIILKGNLPKLDLEAFKYLWSNASTYQQDIILKGNLPELDLEAFKYLWSRASTYQQDIIIHLKSNEINQKKKNIGQESEKLVVLREESRITNSFEFDIFISHASEDKESFVKELAIKLSNKGLNVWFDEFTLTIGDSLRRSIDYGLANSRYGAVVLSKKFFEKEWPQKELDGLVAREEGLNKVILPIWHDITKEEVKSFSPILADRLAVLSKHGIDYVADTLVKVIIKDSI